MKFSDAVLDILWRTICFNQDLLEELLQRNPEEFRYVAEHLGSSILPAEMNIESLRLSHLCGMSIEDLKENYILDTQGQIYILLRINRQNIAFIST